MLKKIAFCGLDDEKRHSLATYIAHQLKTYCVPDYKKEFAKMVNRDLTPVDYKKIAKGMLNLEQEYEIISKDYLCFDNNIVQLFMEAEMNFNSEITWAKKEDVIYSFDLYIFTDEQSNDFNIALKRMLGNKKILFANKITKVDLPKLLISNF